MDKPLLLEEGKTLSLSSGKYSAPTDTYDFGSVTAALNTPTPKDPFGTAVDRMLDNIDFWAQVDTTAIVNTSSGVTDVVILTNAGSATLVDSSGDLTSSTTVIATLKLGGDRAANTEPVVQRLKHLSVKRYIGIAAYANGNAISAGVINAGIGHAPYGNRMRG